MKNGTLTYRVGQLEKVVDKLDNKLDTVMENHLPHIEKQIVVCNEKLESLEMKIKLAVMVNVVQMVSLVIGIVLLLRN